MLMFQAIAGGAIVYNVFSKIYEISLRRATGWEDPETKEFEQK